MIVTAKVGRGKLSERDIVAVMEARVMMMMMYGWWPKKNKRWSKSMSATNIDVYSFHKKENCIVT